VLAKLFSYDRDKVRRFAFKFLQNAQDGFTEIETALGSGNLDRVRELGHRLKSAARTVGALGLAELCQQLENLARGGADGGHAEARLLVAQLWPLLEKITEQIMQNTTFADDP